MKTKIICGIEEAGRGPVIGPMIMVGCTIKAKDEQLLKKIGVKDSKLLSHLQRKELFNKIIALVDYEISILSPSIIDSALKDSSMNLNKLEALTSAKIINKLKPDSVIVDCPAKDTAGYASLIVEHLDKKIKVIAEHKADVNYPIVSAASILAKVTRDEEIEKLHKEFNVDFGSGYPSDEKTQEFVNKHYQDYNFFRKTWQTYKNVVDGKKQKKLFDF